MTGFFVKLNKAMYILYVLADYCNLKIFVVIFVLFFKLFQQFWSLGMDIYICLWAKCFLYLGKTPCIKSLAANQGVDMVFSQENYQKGQCIVSSSGFKSSGGEKSGKQSKRERTGWMRHGNYCTLGTSRKG